MVDAFPDSEWRSPSRGSARRTADDEWQVPRVPRPDSVPSVVASHITSPVAHAADVRHRAKAHVEFDGFRSLPVIASTKSAASPSSSRRPASPSRPSSREGTHAPARGLSVSSPIALPASSHRLPMDTDGGAWGAFVPLPPVAVDVAAQRTRGSTSPSPQSAYDSPPSRVHRIQLSQLKRSATQRVVRVRDRAASPSPTPPDNVTREPPRRPVVAVHVRSCSCVPLNPAAGGGGAFRCRRSLLTVGAANHGVSVGCCRAASQPQPLSTTLLGSAKPWCPSRVPPAPACSCSHHARVCDSVAANAP